MQQACGTCVSMHTTAFACCFLPLCGTRLQLPVCSPLSSSSSPLPPLPRPLSHQVRACGA